MYYKPRENTDNKMIVDVHVRKLSEKYEDITHTSQRGFVAGRNFLNNTLDLDAAGRIHSMHYTNQKYDTVLCPDLIPILPLFDFESAFPSVIHE